MKYGIPVKHVLFANHSLGKISKEQLVADFPVWHTSLHNPDWAACGRLCGATGIKADRREQLDQAMTQLFAADGPAMLHVIQDPELQLPGPGPRTVASAGPAPDHARTPANIGSPGDPIRPSSSQVTVVDGHKWAPGPGAARLVRRVQPAPASGGYLSM